MQIHQHAKAATESAELAAGDVAMWQCCSTQSTCCDISTICHPIRKSARSALAAPWLPHRARDIVNRSLTSCIEHVAALGSSGPLCPVRTVVLSDVCRIQSIRKLNQGARKSWHNLMSALWETRLQCPPRHPCPCLRPCLCLSLRLV